MEFYESMVSVFCTLALITPAAILAFFIAMSRAGPPVALMAKIRRDYDVDPECMTSSEDTVPRSYCGPVDRDRLNRLSSDVDAVCRDVGLKLPDERSQALARVLYDGGADAGAANRKQLRGTLLALSPVN